MEKLIKQSNENKDKKKSLLDNKKGIFIGIGIIFILLLIVIFFRSGGTSVKVATGVAPTEVQSTVEKTVEPIYKQQKEIQEQLKKQQQETAKLTEILEKLNKNIEKIGQTKQSKIQQKINIPPSVIGKRKIENKNVKMEFKPQNLLNHKSIAVSEKSKNVKKVITGITKISTDEKKRKNPTVYIPAGSIAFGKLMYGFTAPERGLFPPVIVELTKATSTSNRFWIPLQKCRITTKAQYNLSQGLAVLGGKDSILSCVLPNGKVVQKKVNIAVGEEVKDGIVQIGLSGVEKWLTGKELATFGVLTTGVGVAEAYQQANTVQSLSPQGNVVVAVKNSLGYGLAGGVSSTLNKFAEFWFKKFDRKYPAIQVLPKKVFITFIQGVDLGIEEKEL